MNSKSPSASALTISPFSFNCFLPANISRLYISLLRNFTSKARYAVWNSVESWFARSACIMRFLDEKRLPLRSSSAYAPINQKSSVSGWASKALPTVRFSFYRLFVRTKNSRYSFHTCLFCLNLRQTRSYRCIIRRLMPLSCLKSVFVGPLAKFFFLLTLILSSYRSYLIASKKKSIDASFLYS